MLFQQFYNVFGRNCVSDPAGFFQHAFLTFFDKDFIDKGFSIPYELISEATGSSKVVSIPEMNDSILDRNSTTYDYDNYILAMVEDGQSSDNSLATDNHVKTDYRLSLPSSSQIHTYRINLNPTISDQRKKLLARIITIVAMFLLVVCILLVTLTLRLAHKIDELVRSQQIMPKSNTFVLISTTTAGTVTNNSIHRRRTSSSFSLSSFSTISLSF